MADKYAHLHSRKKNANRTGRKAQVSLMIVFFIVAMLIVVIAAVLAPLGVDINTKFYEAGEEILLDANASIAAINDSGVRAEIYETVGDAMDNTQTNIEVNAAVFKYGWVFVLVMACLVVFLYTRRLVEYGGSGLI